LMSEFLFCSEMTLPKKEKSTIIKASDDRNSIKWFKRKG